MNDTHIKQSRMKKGYILPCGYMGYIDGKWMLFPTEMEYIEACDLQIEIDCDNQNGD